ncbi:signal recognition particle 19 kDa protein [Daktulosphaira vitifoliae]|uniref:signal recognition particle 19 kDa protein n=1 Tax=Daktulosphaira vitifoliae TaxID=58002 RepID=UPI0021A98254|nr:signal recognition particle 19 kDa protein [Daktulosphaira vitifoliae]
MIPVIDIAISSKIYVIHLGKFHLLCNFIFRKMASIYSDRKPSDRSRWICIYPAYINNKKTIAEGRIVPKKYAVENPTYQEIFEVVKAMGFNAEVENKKYSRECSNEWAFRGRIRIQLKNDDGTPVNETYPTRVSLMKHCGVQIPKLKSRAMKASGPEQSQTKNEASGNKKKKGRK